MPTICLMPSKRCADRAGIGSQTEGRPGTGVVLGFDAVAGDCGRDVHTTVALMFAAGKQESDMARRTLPRDHAPNRKEMASPLSQDVRPMRLPLLRLTPEEYATMAADLGPDGVAAAEVSRVRRLRRTAAIRRAALIELLAPEDRQSISPILI